MTGTRTIEEQTGTQAIEEQRFRRIFRMAHADHARCLEDEWLSEPCRLRDGTVAGRPVVWSRRNGAWRRVETLWVGAAPGNAGGKGAGDLGAHGTRIPFGGDISGANVDALFGSIGLNRNETFIVAALNQLPARGGGEPTIAELNAPVGAFPTSLHLLRETVVAAGPRLIVALGTVALRATVTAVRLAARAGRSGDRGGRAALLGAARLHRAGLARGVAVPWPAAEPADEAFLAAWHEAWGDAPLPHVLWLMHPSAQNMSPFAGVETPFHARMIEARDALRRAVREVLGRAVPAVRAAPPADGVYALPEWRERIAPRHARLDELWRAKGV
ncbi:MAG TPA: uracil-DNA glycosylase family protein [Longimicrobiales bacterium]